MRYRHLPATEPLDNEQKDERSPAAGLSVEQWGGPGVCGRGDLGGSLQSAALPVWAQYLNPQPQLVLNARHPLISLLFSA